MDKVQDRTKRVCIDGMCYRLNGALGIRDSQYGTGVTLEEVYVHPRARRVILKTYSVWDNGHGACCGTSYSMYDAGNEYDADYIGYMAEKYDSDALRDILPLASDE